MNFENYKILPNIQTNKTDLFLATKEEIKRCEKALNINFDEDYKQYVLTYGFGVLSTFIIIYLPQLIIKIMTKRSGLIAKYKFWDDMQQPLTKKDVLNSIVIGETLDGDEIIFFESTYYILAHDLKMIYRAGISLEETIRWICSTDILIETFIEGDFEPLDPREL